MQHLSLANSPVCRLGLQWICDLLYGNHSRNRLGCRNSKNFDFIKSPVPASGLPGELDTKQSDNE